MTDRLKASIEAILEAILGPRIDRCALYPARVVAQAADGSLEVMLDDTRFPSMTKVPIRTPVPGATVKVQTGARVLIGWEATEEARGPDPRRPYASLWEGGTLSELRIPVQTLLALAGGTQFVALANLVKAELDKIQTTLATGTVANESGGGSTPVLWGTPYASSEVAAMKVKAE